MLMSDRCFRSVPLSGRIAVGRHTACAASLIFIGGRLEMPFGYSFGYRWIQMGLQYAADKTATLPNELGIGQEAFASWYGLIKV